MSLESRISGLLQCPRVKEITFRNVGDELVMAYMAIDGQRVATGKLVDMQGDVCDQLTNLAIKALGPMYDVPLAKHGL